MNIVVNDIESNHIVNLVVNRNETLRNTVPIAGSCVTIRGLSLNQQGTPVAASPKPLRN